MIIAFIGNCHTLTLCYYFQELLKNTNYTTYWLLYGDEFKQHLGNWTNKCNNKIINYDESIETIKICDIIIYQEIVTSKSVFSNNAFLQETKKENCRLIKIPSIQFDYNHFNRSLRELKEREKINNTDIKVSQLFEKFKGYNLMLTPNHPKTCLFLEVVKELCLLLNIKFFTKKQCMLFLKNSNFMELP
jgi:hypothetical protein